MIFLVLENQIRKYFYVYNPPGRYSVDIAVQSIPNTNLLLLTVNTNFQTSGTMHCQRHSQPSHECLSA